MTIKILIRKEQETKSRS